jgi:flagellar motor switch protein FliN
MVIDRLSGFEDIGLSLQVELDRVSMTVGELQELKPGAVLSLSRPAGDNIEIYSGDVLLGWGEVSVVEGKLAFRLSDLRNPPFRPSEE